MNKKLFLSVAIVLLAVAAVGGATMAWFTDQSDPLENVFTAGTVIIDADETQFITETFDPLNWNPGDCAQKEYTITNSGTKSIKLRAMLETQWYEWTGDGDPSYPVDPENVNWQEWTPTGDDAASVVLLVTDPAQDWEQRDDGNWYYNGNDGTIDGTFSDNNPATVNLWLEVCLDGPTADNQYQGKTFFMKVTFQAIQASHEGGPDGWEWDDNINFETGLVEED